MDMALRGQCIGYVALENKTHQRPYLVRIFTYYLAVQLKTVCGDLQIEPTSPLHASHQLPVPGNLPETNAAARHT
jgi:hypothetical protein